MLEEGNKRTRLFLLFNVDAFFSGAAVIFLGAQKENNLSRVLLLFLLPGHYVFLMGSYRVLYILNWVYRAHYEEGYIHHPLLYFAALVQTLLYVDFFYYYAIR